MHSVAGLLPAGAPAGPARAVPGPAPHLDGRGGRGRRQRHRPARAPRRSPRRACCSSTRRPSSPPACSTRCGSRSRAGGSASAAPPAPPPTRPASRWCWPRTRARARSPTTTAPAAPRRAAATWRGCPGRCWTASTCTCRSPDQPRRAAGRAGGGRAERGRRRAGAAGPGGGAPPASPARRGGRNGEVPPAELRRRWPVPGTATRSAEQALDAGHLTARGYGRVLRLAWTLADLRAAPVPERATSTTRSASGSARATWRRRDARSGPGAGGASGSGSPASRSSRLVEPGAGVGRGGRGARGARRVAGAARAAGAWPVSARARRRAPRAGADADPRRDLDARALGGRVLPGRRGVAGGPAELRRPAGRGRTRRRWRCSLGPGALRQAVERSVAVVGARAATAYGVHVARDLGFGLAERGATVVSGAAYGIDGAAHARGARGRGGAPTVAVLACGVDVAYPRGHDRLLARIAAPGLVSARCRRARPDAVAVPGPQPAHRGAVARDGRRRGGAAQRVAVDGGPRRGAVAAGHGRARAGHVRGVRRLPRAAARRGALRDQRRARCSSAVGAAGRTSATPARGGRPRDGLSAVVRQVLDAVPVRAARGGEHRPHGRGHRRWSCSRCCRRCRWPGWWSGWRGATG